MIRCLAAALLLANPMQMCMGDGIVDNGSVIERRLSGTKRPHKRHNVDSQRSLVRNPNDRQTDAWKMIDNFEAYKTDRIFGSGVPSDSRKTFSSYHYIVLPIYWKGKTLEHLEMSSIERVLEKTVENYSSQSFGKFNLTYELLPQTEFTLSWPSYGQARSAATALIKDLKSYEISVDYDGILFIYPPQGEGGNFCCDVGAADVGGTFATVGFSPDLQYMYQITRHELGHNFGHLHHVHNHYDFRNSRPNPSSIKDGFDMMSGGNSYERSDFGVASKWFFNWVSSNSIVSMQPEGQTAECLSCVSSGTFTLKPFDDWENPPGDNDIVGIRMPIAKVYSEEWQTDLVYSYWLSYRTGVGGHLADGLAIHLVWFEFADPSYHMKMGTYFDSMNFDVFGATSDKSDSVILENSCYHVSPPPYMLDLDFISANAVQPVVCVGSVNVGSDITVSVSFIDPENPPSPLPNVVEHSLHCSTSTASASYVVDARGTNSFHLKGLGDGGSVTMSSLASDQGWDWAYFYDGYPYSPLVYGSDAGYGSMQRLGSSEVYGCSDCGVKSESLTYTALFGEVYVVIPPMSWAPEGSRTAVTLSCKTYNCLRNEYMENGRCNRCQSHHWANQGATSRSQCQACPSGTHLSHPNAPECSIGYRELPPTDPPSKSPSLHPTSKPTAKPTPAPVPTITSAPVPVPTVTSAPVPVPTVTSAPVPVPTVTSAPVSMPTVTSAPVPVPTVTSAPVSMPIVTSAPVIPHCSQDPNAKFLMKVLSGYGHAIGRTCAWLERKKRRQDKLCGMDLEHGGLQSAKYVCFEICHSCEYSGVDDPSAKFLKKTKMKNNGQIRKITKTCGWLAKKPQNKITKYCRKNESLDGIETAKIACPNTCSAYVT